MADQIETLGRFDSKTISFEVEPGGKFYAKATGWDEKRTMLQGEMLTVWVQGGQLVVSKMPAPAFVQPGPSVPWSDDDLDAYLAGGDV